MFFDKHRSTQNVTFSNVKKVIRAKETAQRNKPVINRFETTYREWRDNFCTFAIAYLSRVEIFKIY